MKDGNEVGQTIHHRLAFTEFVREVEPSLRLALVAAFGADAGVEGPTMTESRFMAGEVIDLVGAGDSFRAGFLAYVARNIDGFREATIDFSQAVQMGNLFAALYIKAPLDDRYGHIRGYRKMLKAVTSGRVYETFDELMGDVG